MRIFKDAFPVSGRGQFPPMMQRHVTPDLRGQRGHGEVRGTGSGGAGSGGGGAGTGSGLGGKSNLAAQIIPVYGFGILLYILYILFKLNKRDENAKKRHKATKNPDKTASKIRQQCVATSV
uniref:Resistance to inhibitors of cholinesterase protein 3 N-terminal domain-containing protein n=1 Tax=Neogobius melanostomus TaxID=47308 RepID=A0A8C6TUB5_9GOBI